MNRTTLRLLRAWLMLLLAVLLPLRGVVAAALPCPMVADAPMAAVAAPADHTGHGLQGDGPGHDGHHGHDDPAGASMAPSHPTDGAHGHDRAADACNLCAASCSAAGLPVTAIALPEAPPHLARFPAVHAPATTFQSDGQDRPPRTT